jgi:hypothetical protein
MPRDDRQPCSICGRMFTARESNNVQPVNSGRCCDDCNRDVVIPARILQDTGGDPPTLH